MPNNILQQVITYNDGGLALLQNMFAFIETANKKFNNFNDDVPKNLGDTVSFELPPLFTTTSSLVANFQGTEQNVQQLTVDQQISTAYSFTAQQFIFNVRDYMEKFGRSAIGEIGSKIEADIASVAETNTYRFYGDGINPISTYLQLATMLEQYRSVGSTEIDMKCYLSNVTYPGIVNSGLGQFAPIRNDRQALSWEVGEFSGCKWYRSNLLKVHEAGSEGNAGVTLTVVSVVKNADDAVTQIVFSGTSAASDANSVKAYDKFQFSDGVSGRTNLRFLTQYGHFPSSSPVQFRATADAASTAGSQVTVDVYPPLKASAGKNQNINTEIVAGMQATVLPDHRCGLLISGNPLYLAMPRLPEEVPYPTAVATDKDSGASLRQYYGSLFGQNQRGMIHDAIWGKTLVDKYAMLVALPV